MKQPDELFNRLTAKIRRTYRELDHQLGWRFLYSSRDTLKPSTRIVFIGLNPGGKKLEKTRASCEEGNAYHFETWKPPGHNSLQEQVCMLYEGIAKAIRSKSPINLMDESLAANFIPFRSANYKKLVSKPGCMELSREIWASILEHVQPKLVITMGREVTQEIAALIGKDATLTAPIKGKTGWGKITYDLRWATCGKRRTLIIGLPHLSRFRIIGRSAGETPMQPMWDAIRESMR